MNTATATAPSSNEVQAARAYLYSRHKKGLRIPPRAFAGAAKELGMGFRELLRFISMVYSRGQQGSVFREAAISKIVRGAK